MSTPILFVGDSPNLHTGLGRIGRDLAFLTSRLPEFRVGYFGRGGHYTRSLPFAQYNFQPTYDSQWGEKFFFEAWHDFMRGQEQGGILFSVWDPSRVVWIGRPDYGGDPRYDLLRDLLTSGAVEKWSYFAIDGKGPGDDGALTGLLRDTLAGYDRPLYYTGFGAEVARATLGWFQNLPAHLPHGIDLDKFQPRDRKLARALYEMRDDEFVVGCVMTNQPRKDWGALIAGFKMLAQSEGARKVRLLCRTDDLTEHWNIPALIEDHGLTPYQVGITLKQMTDTEMSWFYSACDLTVLPSLGEGFGYPIAESLACGVPAIHVDYAGGAEILHNAGLSKFLLPVHGWRLDTRWNFVRPVIDPVMLSVAIKTRMLEGPVEPALCRAAVEPYGWPTLWPKWKEWLLAGLEG